MVNSKAVQASPREVQHAEATATATFRKMMADQWIPKATLKRLWVYHAVKLQAARAADADASAQLALIQQAQAALQAVAQLPPRDLAVLFDRDTMIERTGYRPDVAEAADAIMAAHALLGPIFAAMAEADAVVSARVAAANARASRAAAEAWPGQLLAAMRERGIALDVDRLGNITAPRNAALTDSDRETIAYLKPALVALIRAEAEAAAEAAKPVVLA